MKSFTNIFYSKKLESIGMKNEFEPLFQFEKRRLQMPIDGILQYNTMRRSRTFQTSASVIVRSNNTRNLK